MPKVHNPTPYSLYCAPLDRHVAGGKSIEVSEGDAQKVRGAVFQVLPDEPKELPVIKPKATRTTAKRGGKVAEVSGPPERETR